MMVAAMSSCSVSHAPDGGPVSRRAGTTPHPPGPPPVTAESRSTGRPRQATMITATTDEDFAPVRLRMRQRSSRARASSPMAVFRSRSNWSLDRMRSWRSAMMLPMPLVVHGASMARGPGPLMTARRECRPGPWPYWSAGRIRRQSWPRPLPVRTRPKSPAGAERPACKTTPSPAEQATAAYSYQRPARCPDLPRTACHRGRH